jgi:hypothetical protein
VEVRLPTARSVAKVEPQAAPAEEPLRIVGGRVALDIGGDAVLLVIRGRSRPGA